MWSDRDIPVPLKLGTFGPGALRWARALSACWWGKSSPRLRRVAGLRGRSATLELRHGPDTYGWQQSRIIHNGGNPDGATPRGGWRSSDCKPLSFVNKPFGLIDQKLIVAKEEGTANSVPAAAVIRRSQALFGFTGRKGCVGGQESLMWKLRAQLGKCIEYYLAWGSEGRLEFSV